MNIAELCAFFSREKNEAGSEERLRNLLSVFRDGDYLVAGSWGIEIATGKRFRHTDIDVIMLGEYAWYVDDATTAEERCKGRIPFSAQRLLETAVRRRFEGREVLVPSFEFQVAAKVFGQLEKEYPQEALRQLFALFGACDRLENEELSDVFRQVLPEDLDHERLATEIMAAYRSFREGDPESAERRVRKTHGEINRVLSREFERIRQGLELTR